MSKFIMFQTKLTGTRYIRASSIHSIYYNTFTKATTLDTETGNFQLVEEEGDVENVVRKIMREERK